MAVQPIPEGYHTVTPYLVVKEVATLIDFLKKAFSAEARGIHEAPDGRVVHAEVLLGDSIVMMGEANDEYPPAQSMLHLYVEDVDAVYEQAIRAGGASIREPQDEFYGDRSAGVKGPAGNKWWIATHVEDVSPEEIRRRAEEAA